MDSTRGRLRTAPGRAPATRGVDPNRLTRFLETGSGASDTGMDFGGFDGGGGVGVGGLPSRRSLARPRTVYDPSLSWDGLSVDPRPFARLDKPKEVVEQTDEVPKGVFTGAAGETAPPHGVDVVPRTLDQRDTATAGRNARAFSDGDGGGRLSTETFHNMAVTAPRVAHDVPPAVAENLDATGQLTHHLLAPAERRAILHYERDQQRTRATHKRGELQRRRLVQLLQHRYPNGAMQVDGVAADAVRGTSVYANKSGKQRDTAERRHRHATGRQDKLAHIGQTSRRVGYHPFTHDHMPPPAGVDHFMQSKANHAPALDTHHRLFGQDPYKDRPERTQKLREEDLGGKQHNIVLHTLITEAPARWPERVPSMRSMQHPSQNSLERGRNTTGHMMPSDRMTGVHYDPRTHHLLDPHKRPGPGGSWV